MPSHGSWSPFGRACGRERAGPAGRRPGVWRARSGPVLVKLDQMSGELRVKNRRAELEALAHRSPERVTVSVQLGDLAYAATVDFEPHRGTGRYRAPGD